jgi:hypothetical protein
MTWRNNMSREEMIHQLGLDRQYNGLDLLLPALGIFGAGVLVGAGLGLLLAPKSGEELRGDIRRGANQLQNQTQSLIQNTTETVRARLQQGNEAPSTDPQADNPYAEEPA